MLHPDSFHVPEPWSGHIQNAAVLFVSSNPPIDPAEAYPVGDWEDHSRVDFSADRFDRRAVPWVNRRLRPLSATASPAHRDKGTRFWFAARARASELLERPAEPGAAFALTEVVRPSPVRSASTSGCPGAYRIREWPPRSDRPRRSGTPRIARSRAAWWFP